MGNILFKSVDEKIFENILSQDTVITMNLKSDLREGDQVKLTEKNRQTKTPTGRIIYAVVDSQQANRTPQGIQYRLTITRRIETRK